MSTTIFAADLDIDAGRELPAEADDAATISSWSDRDPATIIRRTAKTVWVQRDETRHQSGLGWDAYARGRGEVVTFIRDTDAPVEVYTLRDNGRWVMKGESKRGGRRLSIGQRHVYRDPSF